MRAVDAAGTPPLGTLPPGEARISYAASRRALQSPFDPVAAVEDIADSPALSGGASIASI